MDKERLKELLYDINKTHDHDEIHEMIEDYVWDGQALPIVTEIQRLVYNADDILVIKVQKQTLQSNNIHRFLDQIEKRISDRLNVDDPIIFMVSEYEDIEAFDEKDMKLYGWAKI